MSLRIYNDDGSLFGWTETVAYNPQGIDTNGSDSEPRAADEFSPEGEPENRIHATTWAEPTTVGSELPYLATSSGSERSVPWVAIIAGAAGVGLFLWATR